MGNRVVPSSLFLSLMNSLILLAATMLRPIVGSSKKTIGGLWIREAANSHLIRSPRDNFFG